MAVDDSIKAILFQKAACLSSLTPRSPQKAPKNNGAYIKTNVYGMNSPDSLSEFHY